MTTRRAAGTGAVLAGIALALLLPAGPAAAEGAGGPSTSAGSPSNGTYAARVSVTGTGVGRGGDLKGPPVHGGGGSTVIHDSPCGYIAVGTQEDAEQAYLEMAK